MKYFKYILIIALFIFTSQALAFSSTTSMHYGSRGSAVTELQLELQRQQFLPSTANIDGRFGRITLRAVQLYQQSHGLTSDGVAGPLTLSLLRADSNTTSTTTTTTTTNINTTTGSTSASAPTITLYGFNPDNSANWGSNGYIDPGYGATDLIDGNITSKVTFTDQYDPSTYCSQVMIRTYRVTNSRGLTAMATRRYTPPFMRECAAPPVGTDDRTLQNTPPIITLLGANPDNNPTWTNGYTDPGYSATDSEDGNITSKVTYTDEYDPSTYCSNTMIRTYTVTDSGGLSATATRRYQPPFMRECAAPPTGGATDVR